MSHINESMIRPKLNLSLPRRMEGFTFLLVLAIIVIMGVGLMGVNEIWSTSRQREKEQELLFIGHQFRDAIQQYSASHPRGKQIQTYPLSLEDLLIDTRYPNIHRYLRKIYIDPMTGASEWGLRKYANGGIYGVYSLSEEAPIKRDNFDLADALFKGSTQYSSWAFTISSQVSASSPAVTNTGTIMPKSFTLK